MKRILLLLLISFIAMSKIPQNTPVISAKKIVNKIEINGIDDEDVWAIIEPIKEFYQRVPNEGKLSTFPMEVKICYDSDNFYVYAKMYYDQNKGLEQRLTRRDNYTMTDWFSVFLDPNFDKRNGYFFMVNPNNVKVDGILYNDQWDDNSWDAVWESQTVIDSNYWAVEMKIPFSQIRFQNRDNMQWGINFKRTFVALKEEDYFVMVPRNEAGFVSKFAILKDISGVNQKNSTEIWPYFVVKHQSLQWKKNDPFIASNRIKTSYGLDIKRSITNNLNLNLTVYPDFGQVEADPATVNLSVFETYFNEKRQFFIEGSEIFNFGGLGVNNNWNFNWMEPELFYSRRIGRAPQLNTNKDYDFSDRPSQTNIILAAKVSGKLDDDLSVGLLNATTERTYGRYEYNHQQFKDEIEPLTNYNIIRLLKEFQQGEKGLGIIWTSTNRNLRNDLAKNRLASSANVIGLDGWMNLDEDGIYALKGYFAYSYVQGNNNYLLRLQKRSTRYYQNPDNYYSLDSNAQFLDGYITRLMLNKQSGNFYINAAIGVASPGFEANDLGFINSVDKINSHFVIGYRWYQPDGIFRTKSIYSALSLSKNFSGYTTSNFVRLFGNFQLMSYWGGSLNIFYGFDAYDPRLTRGGPTVKTPGGYNINANWYTDSRNRFIFSNGFELNNNENGSSSYNVWASFDWRVNKHLTTTFTPSFGYSFDKNQWVDRFEDNSLNSVNGYKYVFGELKNYDFSTSLRMDYFFTSEMSLQLYLRPYFNVGKYNRYHYLIDAKKGEYQYFDENNITKANNTIKINDGNNVYEFDVPDFKYVSLRGNLVFRWEYIQGSTLYLIWSLQNDQNDNYSPMSIVKDFNNILNKKANNIFQLKINYWFNA